MATNYIQRFGYGSNANVLTDEEYSERSEIVDGFPIGSDAGSTITNTVLKQAIVGSYALGQLITTRGGVDATSDPTAFANAFDETLIKIINTEAPTPDLSRFVQNVNGVVNQSLTVNGTLTVTEDIVGNVATASALQKPVTLRVDLESSRSVAFDGSSSVSIGVFGQLPLANGGTGRNDGTVNHLATARAISLVGDAQGSTTFDGSRDVSINVTVQRAAIADKAIVADSATTCSGNAESATKLGTSTVGSSTQPIYLEQGTPTAGSKYVPTTGGTFNGNITVNGDFVANTIEALSDVRYKIIDDVVDDPDLSAVHAYKYRLRDDRTQKERIGVIAQEVQQVVPQCVDTTNPNKYTVDYNGLIALLIAKINKLEQRLDALTNQSIR